MDTEVKSGNRKGKPNYPVGVERRLAIATCKPGVSVSKLALAHQVNANMVFKWRRDFRAGLLDIKAQAPATLLPMTLSRAPSQRASAVSAPPIPNGVGMIEIAIAHALVRVRGGVDAVLLKTVIESPRA